MIKRLYFAVFAVVVMPLAGMVLGFQEATRTAKRSLQGEYDSYNYKDAMQL